MKAFITSIRNHKVTPKTRFILQTLGYYALLMLLYLYFALADLSTAPPFLYSQF